MPNNFRIQNVLFVYLTQVSGATYVTDDIGPRIQRRPLIGLQYLCAVLEQAGVRTDILDERISTFEIDDMINIVSKYDLVGFYCSDPQEEKVKAYCCRIKARRDIPVIIGGPTTLKNSSFLNFGADFVVHGEGERTILQVVQYYNGEISKKDIKGVSYAENNETIYAEAQPLIEDLDALPFPDRSKHDINLFFDYYLFTFRKPYVTMLASRGCPYTCTFCSSYKIWGCRYRARSVDNVLKEIDDIVARYKVKYVAFQDDVFGLNESWIEEFCKKLMQRPYRIRWMAILHPFSAKKNTEKILKLMKQAGCDTLSLGIQSAHPGILKNVNRHPGEPGQVKRLIAVANKLGFVTYVMYIFGLPGDTRETIKMTREHSLSCGATVVTYNILYQLKGSDLRQSYRGEDVCGLTQEELIQASVAASRKFYLRPMALLKIAKIIIKNPSWLAHVFLNIGSILARAGLMNPRKC